MIVGGNIRFHTRTMTTSIAMLRNQGETQHGISLGVLLMAIAFSVQLVTDYIRKTERRTDENF
jgi:tungstate transport system permease protein